MHGDAIKIGLRAIAQPHRQHEGQAKPYGDSFSMQQAPVIPHFCFQSVTECVPQIEERTATLCLCFEFILCHHSSLKGAGPFDRFGKGVGVL